MRRIKQILYEGNKGRWPFFPGSMGHQHSKQYSFADDQNSFIHKGQRRGGGGGVVLGGVGEEKRGNNKY